jgi:hypothetical protein
LGHHKPAHWGLLGVTWVLALGQLPEIFRHDPFGAVTGAALPRSIGKTAVATPHQLTL